MESSRTRPFILGVAALAISGVVAYAIYFDYKRRTDATFRRRLKKEQKKVNKSRGPEPSVLVPGISSNDLRDALEKIRGETVPDSVQEKELYFMEQVGIGEQLSTRGPNFHLAAALSFYRALRVYPSPVELIVIYERTVPADIFKIVMELTSLDVKDKVEGYYNYFPPKSMNVEVSQLTKPDGGRKNILLASRDFETGEVVYKEQPVVTALDSDLEAKGTYCSQCLRKIVKGMSLQAPDDIAKATYCSRECQTQAAAQHHKLLFSLEPAIPSAAQEETPEATKKRRDAQEEWLKSMEGHKTSSTSGPLLVARFLARQVSAETAKMNSATGRAPQLAVAQEDTSSQYSLYDHIERLRYLELSGTEKDSAALRKVLATAMEGLQEFVTDDRYATLRGKMAYNCIGVCYSGGRDDKPVAEIRPEDVEKTRTPFGTQRQIGCGLYSVTSYVSHSCNPNARPSFADGTAHLSLVANRPIKKGEEITIAFVDVSQKHGETVIDARRRRRMELVRGWRFACECQRCTDEAPLNGSASDILPNTDGSRVERVVSSFEDGPAF
ncbi:SET domain-containing protein [Sistotremastrum niveocremeum HHB9708]|uniref:SET domain-containing protein n=1 Tax=Sistotremastrum niveocremeum HHB9708 TaxID=1314777 RepID=A0A164ZT87_9AGAM|nr:SET domain-containing protein [Sistotremastrum niveocremeum HHB9708]